MKIGFASDAAYPWFKGGMEKRRYLISQELVAAGHEVHLFTMYRQGMPGEGSFAYRGVHYHCVGKALPPEAMYKNGRRNIKWPLKYALLLPIIIQRHRFDLIDTDAFPFLHIPKLAAYAKLTRAKFVITWHEAWDKKYWKSYLPNFGMLGYSIEKLSARLAKKAIANTTQTEQELESVLNFSKDQITVFPAAISKLKMRRFAKLHPKKSSGEFIAIGRLVEEKGMETAVRAVAQTDSKLTIVGSGPDKKYLEGLSRKLGASNRIRFMQDIKEDELLLMLRNASALLMFSKREGMSIVSIEALSLGTPVIITRQTSLPNEIRKYAHVIDDKESGKALRELLKNGQSVLYKPNIPIAKVQEEFCSEKAGAIYQKLAK